MSDSLMNYPTKNATQSLRSSAMRSPRGKNVRTTFSPKDSKHKKEVKNEQEEANIEREMKNFSNQEAKKKMINRRLNQYHYISIPLSGDIR